MFSTSTASSFAESPSLLFTSGGDIFIKYFYRKSALTLAVKLTEDLMRGQSYSDHAVSCAADAVYLAVITLQGSTQTSGSGYAAMTLMKFAGYSNDSAWWGGYAVSLAVCLAMDMSPWGVFFTTISTLGGEFGKDAAATLYSSAKKFCEEVYQDRHSERSVLTY